MNTVKDKSVLFAHTEEKCYELKVAPQSDECLKVWIREPTWLEVEKALTTLMKIDANNSMRNPSPYFWVFPHMTRRRAPFARWLLKVPDEKAALSSGSQVQPSAAWWV